MDTLFSLKVFTQVAEHKSFAAVARRLSISPAMTSKHIKHVEQRVGARLLNRNSRNVSLTEAGIRYLTRVKPLLSELSNVEAQLSETTLAAHGTLKISMPIWMANSSFTDILAAYQNENPNVILDIDLSGRKTNLVEEGFDLALRVTHALKEGLIARKLANIKFHLIASPNLLDRIGRPKALEALNGAPFLAYSPMALEGRVRVGLAEDSQEVQFKQVLLTDNETLIREAAISSMGVAFLPDWVIKEEIKQGVLETVLPGQHPIIAPLSAIYPDRSYLPAKVRSFLDFMAGPKGLDTIMKGNHVQ